MSESVFGSEEQNKTGETDQNKEEMVPKSEVEKMKESLTQQSQQLEKLKKEAEEAKLSQLDPEYLAFLESKESDGNQHKQSGNDDLDSLSNSEFMALLENKIDKKLNDRVTFLGNKVDSLIAHSELREVRSKYSDFNDYKDQIGAILNRNPSLNYEQAYKIIKADVYQSKSEEQKQREAKLQQEKPGGPSHSSTKPADFKSSQEAIDDAWNQAVGKDVNEL